MTIMKILADIHRRLILVAFLSVAPPYVCAGGQLIIEPELSEAKYCLGRDDGVTFRITLGLRYRNVGEVPIILSRATQLSSYSLFRNEADMQSNRPEVRRAVPKARMFDALKLDKGKPPSEFFDIIEPGATFDMRVQEVWIVVRPDPKHLLGLDHYLRVVINDWADHWR
jgi:hypothetical protein